MIERGKMKLSFSDVLSRRILPFEKGFMSTRLSTKKQKPRNPCGCEGLWWYLQEYKKSVYFLLIAKCRINDILCSNDVN